MCVLVVGLAVCFYVITNNHQLFLPNGALLTLLVVRSSLVELLFTEKLLHQLLVCLVTQCSQERSVWCLILSFDLAHRFPSWAELAVLL